MSERQLYNSETRALYGCIVSFESEAGAELTLHRSGPPRDALRLACTDALAVDPTLRVVAYSTPQTIYHDLSGARVDFDNFAGHRTEKQRPEVAALAVAGLSHLAHPRLGLGHADSQARANRRARGERAKG